MRHSALGVCFIFFAFTIASCNKDGGKNGSDQEPEKKILKDKDKDSRTSLPAVKDFFMTPRGGVVTTESSELIPFGEEDFKRGFTGMLLKSYPENEPSFDVSQGVKVTAANSRCAILNQDLKSKDNSITLNPSHIVCRKALLDDFNLTNPTDNKPIKAKAHFSFGTIGNIIITTDDKLLITPTNSKFDNKGIAADGSRTNIDYAPLNVKGPISATEGVFCALAKEDTADFKTDSLICIGAPKNRFGDAWGHCGNAPLVDHTFGNSFQACLQKSGEVIFRGARLDMTTALIAGSGGKQLDVTGKKFLALFAYDIWNYLALLINAPSSDEHGKLVFLKDASAHSNFDHIAPMVNRIDPALRFKKVAFASRRQGSEQPFSFCGITMDDALYCVSAEAESALVSDVPKTIKHYE